MKALKTYIDVRQCIHRGVYVVQARNITGIAVCARDGDHVWFYGLREKLGSTFVAAEHGAPEEDRVACSGECGGGYVIPIARLSHTALSVKLTCNDGSVDLLAYLLALQILYIP